MENWGYIRVTNAGSGTRFAHETKSSRFVTEISLIDDFQCHGASQVNVETPGKLSPSRRDPAQQASRLHPWQLQSAQNVPLRSREQPRQKLVLKKAPFLHPKPSATHKLDTIPTPRKTRCRNPGKLVYPPLSWSQPPCRYDKTFESGLSSFVDPYESALPLSPVTLRRPSDDCPAHDVKALRALRWRTMVAFHEKVSLFSQW
jgi:hypothetical protein